MAIFWNSLEMCIQFSYNSPSVPSRCRFLADTKNHSNLNASQINRQLHTAICAICLKVWLISVHRTSIFITLPNYEIKRSCHHFLLFNCADSRNREKKQLFMRDCINHNVDRRPSIFDCCCFFYGYLLLFAWFIRLKRWVFVWVSDGARNVWKKRLYDINSESTILIFKSISQLWWIYLGFWCDVITIIFFHVFCSIRSHSLHTIFSLCVRSTSTIVGCLWLLLLVVVGLH